MRKNDAAQFTKTIKETTKTHILLPTCEFNSKSIWILIGSRYGPLTLSYALSTSIFTIKSRIPFTLTLYYVSNHAKQTTFIIDIPSMKLYYFDYMSKDDITRVETDGYGILNNVIHRMRCYCFLGCL